MRNLTQKNSMKLGIDKVNGAIINIIIVLESLLIGLSYYLPKESTKYLLFSIIGLSTYLGIISIRALLLRFPRVSKEFLLFLALIIFTLIYTGLIRHDLPIAILFISSVMLLVYLYHNGISISNITLLIICNVALALLYIFEFYKTGGNSLYNQSFTRAYGNPNMAGIILYSTLVILITGVFFVRKRLHKIFLTILAFSSFYLLISTSNRGSLVAIIVFAALLIVYRNGSHISNLVRSVMVLFPLIFALVYIYLGLRMYSMGEFLQKPFFSGREIEWQNLIGYILKNPFSIQELPSGGLNLFLSGIIEYGFIAFGSYIILLFILKPNWNQTCRIDYKQVAYIAFLCVFIQQTFESTLISGSFGVYAYNYLLFGIACSKDDILKCQI